MRRVLMISPHFPPDSSAGTHRVRLLAPWLRQYGWEPTVLTVDPAGYEGRLDAGLLRLVPPDLQVVRARALPAGLTRRFGLGDLGLRAWPGLCRSAARLLRRQPFDALFVTLYPTYPAVLGPLLKRRFDLPFVLDYQDPWVGAWGRDVGGGPGGQADRKSRLTRRVATLLEPRVVSHADALVAVSSGTIAALRSRHPWLIVPGVEIPIGGEPGDFERAADGMTGQPAAPGLENADLVHIRCVGTILPRGRGVLRAVLEAVARLRDRSPQQYARLRLDFIGTSNQSTCPDDDLRVLPIARALSVADVVTEAPARVDYLDALRLLSSSGAILMLGSDEPHYTASKLYPGLLARRPIVAVYHEGSSVVPILRAVSRPPAINLVTFGTDEVVPADSIVQALSGVIDRADRGPIPTNEAVLSRFTARTLAGRLAGVFDHVSRHRARRERRAA